MPRLERMPVLLVLRCLLDDPGSGMFLREIIRSSGVPASSLYPLLDRLQHSGLVESWWEDIDESEEGRRRRRYYRLTANGALHAHEALTSAVDALTPPSGVREAPA